MLELRLDDPHLVENFQAALGKANSEMAVLRHDLTCEQESSVHLASVCRWLSDHPWGNLWAWAKRKLGCAE